MCWNLLPFCVTRGMKGNVEPAFAENTLNPEANGYFTLGPDGARKVKHAHPFLCQVEHCVSSHMLCGQICQFNILRLRQAVHESKGPSATAGRVREIGLPPPALCSLAILRQQCLLPLTDATGLQSCSALCQHTGFAETLML